MKIKKESLSLILMLMLTFIFSFSLSKDVDAIVGNRINVDPRINILVPLEPLDHLANSKYKKVKALVLFDHVE